VAVAVAGAVGVAPARSGWVEVEIVGTRDTGDTGEVQVVIRDSGPGVAAEAGEEVFELGYTTKAAADGSVRGFGLALARLVCKRRGGGITVHNDNGAVFTARLPIRATSRGGVPT
jgi:two-component system CitB family sensor kinase